MILIILIWDDITNFIKNNVSDKVNFQQVCNSFFAMVCLDDFVCLRNRFHFS